MSQGAAKNLTIVLVGALMIIYVTVGGMKGTTWVQIVKAVLLMTGALIMTLLVLAKFNFNPSSLLGAAADAERQGRGLPRPGPALRRGRLRPDSKIDLVSLGLALVLGTAGLPHILIRFYTVPTAKDARRSVIWAIGIIGSFYLMTLALGFGAAALVGTEAIRTARPRRQHRGAAAGRGARRRLLGTTGGAILLAFIASVAFATILAVVAGLTLASSSSVAHDLYANVVRGGDVGEKDEVRVARIAALVIGAVAIVLSIFAQNLNVAFLVALAFAVAASANLPAILYSLFWRRFNTQGAVWAIYGGLISAVGLVIFSPVVSGKATAMISDRDFSWFPLENPGIISIPAGLLLRLARDGPVEGAGRPEVRRARGAVADRGRPVLAGSRGTAAPVGGRSPHRCRSVADGQ